MPVLFDPIFNIQFKCDKDFKEVKSEFQIKFESMLIQWKGWLGQNDDYYFDFHRDQAYELGLSPYPYKLLIVGKGRWEDATKQEAHINFAKSVVAHFPEVKPMSTSFQEAVTLLMYLIGNMYSYFLNWAP